MKMSLDSRVINYAVSHGIKNVFHYGVAEEMVFENMASEVGYTRKTTFYSDLSIAEWYGLNGVKDTYNRVSKEWISNVEYFVEFILSLNWKSWEWAGRGYNELGQLYSDLYYKAKDLAYEKWADNKDALHYMFEVLD